MHVTLVYWLLACALVMSVLASYASFCFVERVASSSSRRYAAWLTVGAFVMGLGIWCMHYLGMLAIVLPIPVRYDLPTVLLSLLPGVFASAVALFVISRRDVGPLQITCGSLPMGAAICIMHYTGMRAMRCDAIHTYDPTLVLLSVIVAVCFSWVALWIAFSMKRYDQNRELLRISGAVLMGTGILSVHCVAQAAVTFHAGAMNHSGTHTVHVTTLGFGVVAITTAVILIGALFTALLDRRMCEQITQSNKELCRVRAELMESELALREANDRLTELSIRDALTGIYNRRHFDIMIDAELRRAARSNTPMSLLLIDVDHFKHYNDRHGHPAGDQCLRAVAECLAACLRRPGDLVARYGGEEFAIILPDTDWEGSLLQAELLRSAVCSLYPVNEVAPLLAPVTISIGISFKESFDATPSVTGLIALADEGLYRAKAAGRNCVRSVLSRNAVPVAVRSGMKPASETAQTRALAS